MYGINFNKFLKMHFAYGKKLFKISSPMRKFSQVLQFLKQMVLHNEKINMRACLMSIHIEL